MLTKKQIWLIKILSISPIVWFSLFSIYSYGFLLPRSIENRKNLENELSIIFPPNQTSVENAYSGEKVTFSWANQDHSTRLSAQEVFDYYNGELARNGWIFRNQEFILPPDEWQIKDFCPYSCSRHFCKGRFKATVDYHQGGHYSLLLQSDEMMSCQDDKNLGTSITEALFGIGCSTTWMLYAVAVLIAFAKLNQEELLIFAKQASWQPRDVQWIVVRAIGIFVICLLIYYYCITTLAKYL